MKLVTSAGGLEIPEGEVLDARLANVELHEFTYGGQNIQKLRWKFIVSGGEWEGKEIQGQTSTNFVAHPGCKAYNWATAISGRTFEEGEELDTDELIGLPCRIITAQKTGKDGRIWPDIRDVLPPRGGKPVSEPPF